MSYAIPLLADSDITRKESGLTVASTFAGAGGSCMGYEMAGLEVVWANEFEPNAVSCYERNHAHTFLNATSIRDVHGEDILRESGCDEIDVFNGSPPCQSFSSIGQREKSWGRVIAHGDGTTQRSDDLFWEYARVLGELRPRAFVAENVKGFASGKAKGMFRAVMALLKSKGYQVRAQILDAQHLGVPQHRERVIIIGFRDDLGITPEFPRPFDYTISVRDALPDIEGAHLLTIGNGFNREMPRSLNKPSPTIVATCGVPKLPTRDFTIPEIARLCSFPGDFVFSGTYARQWARLGNSVPPLMMRSIAAEIRRSLEKL